MSIMVDWHYHRDSCAMCSYVERFIESRAGTIKEKVIANECKLGVERAQELMDEADEIWVTRGNKVLHFDMRSEPPTDKELLKLLLAPSGNLRAPTLLAGKHLVVGFTEEAYQQALGQLHSDE
jgi:arsenate reductase-like glutaredoxin family protein